MPGMVLVVKGKLVLTRLCIDMDDFEDELLYAKS